jgi:glycosyltransferase involved in cell wall biosynthesis
LYKNVFFQATTETEKDQIEKYVRNYQKVLVAQNLPSKENLQIESEIVKEQGVLKLFYLARISPEKNLLFALEILNNKKYAGQITFDIYGAINDDKYWNRCQGVINDLPSNIRVEYKGPIKASDCNGVILNYHFLYLPTLGENFGHSILESLLMNVPVIISDQTPWNQLSSQNIGWDVVLKEDAFIEIISNALLLNDNSYQSMRISCEKYVQNFLSNSVQVEQSKQMFF